MAQIFSRSADLRVRLVLLLIGVGVAGAVLVVGGIVRSDWVEGVDVAPPQPVPFSHEHHVSGLGLDCRYCHTTVETEASAGFPPTETCMTCHSQIWTGAPMLAPVRQSWASRTPLRWSRVNDLPDFVYFDHAVHVQNGVGCSTCHGPVHRMPLTVQAAPLTMGWCLDCHRDPARYLRPPEEVFDMDWVAPPDQRARGEALIAAHHIDVPRLDACYTCHR